MIFNQPDLIEAGKLIFVNIQTHWSFLFVFAVYTLWSLSIVIATHPVISPKGNKVDVVFNLAKTMHCTKP